MTVPSASLVPIMTDLSVSLVILIAESVMEVHLTNVTSVMMVTIEILCMTRILVFLIVWIINIKIRQVSMGMQLIRFVQFVIITVLNAMVPAMPNALPVPSVTSSTTATRAKTPETSLNALQNSTAIIKILPTLSAQPVTSFAGIATALEQTNASRAPMATG